MNDSLHSILSDIQDEITELLHLKEVVLTMIARRCERGRRRLPIELEPKSASPARSEPAPDPRPRRVVIGGGGRKAGPLRGWAAELLVDRGPLTVPEILSLKPELDKRQVYNLVTSCPWFERVPDLYPATYQLSAKGREEYAKAKAEGQHDHQGC